MKFAMAVTKNYCEEEMEVCVPIKYGKEVLGAIGLSCYNINQKNNLQKS